MKITIALFGICVLAATAGCQKSGDHSATPSSAKVTYISTLGDITYQGEKLNTIGAYSLLYDGNQRLVGLRRENSGTLPPVGPNLGQTSYYNLVRYSFIWEGGHIVASKLDTLTSATTQNGNIPPGIFTGDETNAYNSLIGIPYGIYFYTGERLDSVLYLADIGDNSPQKVIYEYGPDGNISQETTLYFPTASISPIIHLTKTITRYTYDQHPNPWNRLFKATGVILPSLFVSHNISKNNPIEIDARGIVKQDTFDLQEPIRYEYNSQGYPIMEIMPGLVPDTILYRYN